MRLGSLRVACFVCLFITHSAAIAADSFREFQMAYRCEVVRRLETIYATGDPATERDRYMAVSLANRRHIYVQCIFHSMKTRAYCEAVSGFYLTRPGKPRRYETSWATKNALKRLGFDTDDSIGNFKVNRRVGTPPNFNVLADFMLRALHDGYGARIDDTLKFNAPFAPDVPTSCIPMS